MRLIIDGICKFSREEIETIIYFISKKLRVTKSWKDVELFLRFVTDMESLGECVAEDDGSYVILINIKKCKTRYDILSTLCHELIHLKQFHSGRLIMTNEGGIWNGKKVKMAFDYDILLPWEIEAYGKERGLANAYCYYANNGFKFVAS